MPQQLCASLCFAILACSSIHAANAAGEPIVVAQAPGALTLPRELAGKAVNVKGSGLNLDWSVAVDNVGADGVVRGKVTFIGRFCGAKDAPFVGAFDGTTLSIPMPFEPAVQCKGYVYKLSKKNDSNQFEGIWEGQGQNGYPVAVKLTLEPVAAK